jgi:lysophospholipase L1-like esterase
MLEQEKIVRAVGLLVAIFTLAIAAPLHAARGERWIESWGTPQPLAPPPPSPFEERSDPPPPRAPFADYPRSFADQTIRMIVRTSAGGPRFRLEFANIHAGEAVVFGEIRAALSGQAGAIMPGTDRAVTFGGKPTLTLFPGMRAVSDPIDLPLPPLTEVAVSIYLPQPTPATTVDPLALMPTYIADENQAAASALHAPLTAGAYFWLRGLSVEASDAGAGTIVALGDSITEGYATTAGAHRSWPELLAARLQQDAALSDWGVVNAGISGNRVLRPGAGDALLARLDADVLTRPGVKWVIVLAGINDINMSIIPGMPREQAATAEDIIGGLDQLVDRARVHGLKVAGGTILATKGLPFYSEQGEQMRQAVNAWIRTSGSFDAVIDFDAATRDPADPLRLQPEIDPGDHVHPNDAGNALMAGAIDLDLFRGAE